MGVERLGSIISIPCPPLVSRRTREIASRVLNQRKLPAARAWTPYVLDLPDNATAAAPLIDASLRATRDRGLTWLYPTVKCKHGTGPHQGSCTYADLPSYFDALVDAVERLGAED